MSLRRSLKWVVLSFLTLALFIAFPLVLPAPLFAHNVTLNSLSVHSDQPILEKEARLFLLDVQQRLKRLPLDFHKQPMQIYIANTDWRRKWLWIITPPHTGGFMAAPVTRWHAFFSGADFKTDELVSPSGYRTKPPRTLAYYGAHELTPMS